LKDLICSKLNTILSEVENKTKASEEEYQKLLDQFDLIFDDNFLTLSETEIAKLLQKKKEASLKMQIDDSMTTKWQLKQTLKKTEKDIKVDLIEESQ
jgi:hypothetical protein